jgi:hypothetical protein
MEENKALNICPWMYSLVVWIETLKEDYEEGKWFDPAANKIPSLPNNLNTNIFTYKDKIKLNIYVLTFPFYKHAWDQELFHYDTHQ